MAWSSLTPSVAERCREGIKRELDSNLDGWINSAHPSSNGTSLFSGECSAALYNLSFEYSWGKLNKFATGCQRSRFKIRSDLLNRTRSTLHLQSKSGRNRFAFLITNLIFLSPSHPVNFANEYVKLHIYEPKTDIVLKMPKHVYERETPLTLISWRRLWGGICKILNIDYDGVMLIFLLSIPRVQPFHLKCRRNCWLWYAVNMILSGCPMSMSSALILYLSGEQIINY